jgi:uncharacterized membrane protein YkvI
LTRRQRWTAFQVACTYVGTIVGAGFASGREIYQFFGRFGIWGGFAILVTVFLFSWLGYRMMILGRILNARSFRDVAHYLFGPWVGSFVNLVLLVMLFGVSVTMMAGTGELARESLGMPFTVGVIVTVAISFLTLLRGMTGLMRANSVIVPILVGVLLFAAIRSLFSPHSLANAWQVSASLAHAKPLLAGISAILYAAFNVGLAAGVLIPLGSEITDVAALRAGARAGAVALGAMLLAVTFTLFAHYPQSIEFAVPMGYVASRFGGILQWLFIFVLWGEIYSTLVGNVYAITTQVPTPPNWAEKSWLPGFYNLSLLFLAAAMSGVGFETMVAYGYTVFGWVSLLLLMALMWPRGQLPE